MTIIIYTRDNDTTQFLKNEILTTFLNEQIDFVIFSELKMLTNFLKTSIQRVDVLFFDIDFALNSSNVIDAINKLNIIDYFVVVSNNPAWSHSCSQTSTLRFLNKPLQSNLFFTKLLSNLYTQIKINSSHSHNNSLQYSDYYGEKQLININTIEFIKAHRRYSCLMYNGKEILISKNLGSLEQELKDTTLVRVHRSYIINISFIADISEKRITLSSGKKIPIGPKYINYLYDMFPNVFYAYANRRHYKKICLLR